MDGKKRTKTDKNGPKRTKTDQSVIFALWLSRKLLEIKMAANYKAAYTVDNKMATLFPKNQIKFNIMGGISLGVYGRVRGKDMQYII